MKQRVWELDALRGLCVLGMVAVHFVYDLVELYGLVDWTYPQWFSLVKNWGGVLFLLISGISATLGRRSVRRGAIVFGCGLICTAVTYGMYHFGMSGRGIIIYFGVLHCLGVCMLLWPLVKKWPGWALALPGIALAALGLYFEFAKIRSESFWLVPFGIIYRGFASSDYFPLLPNLGFFLLGGALGKWIYPKKASLFPKVNHRSPIPRFLQACGRQSLLIYLLHQPLLSGICMLLSLLT